MSYEDKDLFGGEENDIFEVLDNMLARARQSISHELGIDPSAFDHLRHSYDSDGVYRGDIADDTTDMKHYGTPRHSGRYPWGSGDNPYQRNAKFLEKVSELTKAKGPDGKRLYSEKQIAEAMGMNTSDLRKRKSAAAAENRAYLYQEAVRLKEKGMSTSAIARRMGRNESSIRILLNEEVNERMTKNVKNAILLKERVAKDKFIDVGKGAEEWVGLSSTGMANTLHLLEEEGYTVHNVDIPQLGTGKMTTTKVLCAPGVEWKEVKNSIDKIRPIKEGLYSEDGGDTIRKVNEYVSIDPKRVMINYPSTGGADKDGVIELRRNVDDISLGKNHYAQVRILVDGDHYLKGMAMYADDLPDGVDIRFNTSKPDGTPMFKRDGVKESVLKPVKEDLENPFGANIKPEEKLTKAQRHYTDENGVEHQSAINIVKEEGDVNSWNRTLASQFLSKQTPALAKHQLQMAYDISKADLDEIASYTNPVVKSTLLEDFAGRCETDAVHLAAAALPRQNNKFILPLTNIRENEIYAPGYRDGEEVVLVRYPHGSISEIPRLIVNNNNREAKNTIGEAIDAVGIHPKAAARLSGADFDGDTVLVIPTAGVNIKNKEQFKGLKDFDPHTEYKGYDGMHVMTSREKGLEMGKVSNLITDMTIRGASDRELEMALKHSMVVIDAEKHKLDYKRSEIDNHIAELKQKYQDGGGTSTLLSRSTGQEHILERKLKAPSKMTPDEYKRYLEGEQIWTLTGKNGQPKTRTFKDPDRSKMTKEEKDIWDNGTKQEQKELRRQLISEGRYKTRVENVMEKTTKGAVNDPYDLVSGGSREKTTSIERVYADYAKSMKDLAKQARKIARNQEDWEPDPAAKKLYSKEVQSLDEKLSLAKRNAVLERHAQRIANAKMSLILDANPELENDKEHYKREKGRQLDAARKIVGAKKLSIGTEKNPLTDREWKAIEAHAVSKSKLLDILNNSDKSRVRELAMPKTKTGLAPAKVARAKSMLANGYSRAEVCDMLYISEGKLISALDL